MERWSVFCIMQKTTVCKRQKLSIIRLYMQSYKRHLLWLECMTCCKKVNWSTLKPYFSGRNKESVDASESIHSLENKSPYPRDKRWKDELRRQWTRPSHLYLLNWPHWDYITSLLINELQNLYCPFCLIPTWIYVWYVPCPIASNLKLQIRPLTKN